jgi:hypothetical protein
MTVLGTILEKLPGVVRDWDTVLGSDTSEAGEIILAKLNPI